MSPRRCLALLPLLASLLSAALPVITRQPEDITANIGGRTGFAITVTSEEPVTYQWFHDNQLLPGATSDVLLLDNASDATAGTYQVNITNASGTATSEPATLRVTVPETDLRDPTFVPAVPIFSPYLVLPDGSIIAGHASGPLREPALVRLHADGSLDESFNFPDTGEITVQSTSARQLRMGPNNTFYLNYIINTGVHGDDHHHYLDRFSIDGSRDASFTPYASGNDTILQVLPTEEGIIVATQQRLFRLTVNGEIDPSFKNFEFFGSKSLEQGADGRIWFGADQLYLVQSDGTLIPQVGPARFQLLPDGGFLTVANIPDPPMNKSGTIMLQRYLPDGTLDETFHSISTSWAYLSKTGYLYPTPLPDGRILVSVDHVNTIQSVRRGSFCRLLSDGSIDPDFQLVIPESESATFGNDYYVYPDASYALIRQGLETIRIRLNPSGAPVPPRILKVAPIDETVVAGDDFEVEYVAVGADLESPTSSTFLAGNAQSDSAIRTLTIKSPWGNATVAYHQPSVIESVPRIEDAPESLALSPDRRLTLQAAFRGTEPMEIKWYRDGENITRSSGYYSFETGEGGGSYRIVATNAIGTTEHTFMINFGPASRLSNLSTRGYAGAGDEVMIIGFILKGDAYWKEVMLRAIGRELRTDFGLTGVLENPRITLFNRDGRILAEGDDTPFLGYIGDNTLERFDALGAFHINHGPSSLLFEKLPPGPYTMHITPAIGSPGIVLGEIYDADNLADRLANVSTRALVRSGDALAISGFAVSGDVSKKLLIRGIGPTLASFGVSNTLADPVLQIFNAAGEVIATNDNWTDAPDQDALRAATTALAFPLAEDAADAALLLEVPPGTYTAQIRGKHDTSGIALVEIYEVP